MKKEKQIELVGKKAVANHVWINAISCIDPTPKTCEDLGRLIIDMLNEKDRLMPAYYGEDPEGDLREFSELTPMLYMSINKS